MKIKKNKKRKASLRRNKFILVTIILMVILASSMLFAIKNGKKFLSQLTNKNQNENVGNNGKKAQESIDCSKQLSQKNESEILKLISQGELDPKECIHMSCGNFF